MAEIDIRNARLEKLKILKEKGINPYPSKSERTHSAKRAINDFERLSKSKKIITLTGRIMSERSHGKATFFDLQDSSGSIQLYFKQDKLGMDNYENLKLLDAGDFLQVSGILFITHKGERTLEVLSYNILAKSLLPIPSSWYGLKDVETRYRKRYLDFLLNKDSREKMITRSKVISSVRNFLEQNDFLEMQFPALESEATGAAARPFVTHYKAYDADVYLRICIETWQKRAIVGGFERTFEIGKAFRNEGVDASHNPDFMMCEFYMAYADYNELMVFTEKLLSNVVKEVTGGYSIKYQGLEVNFKPPYPRISFKKLLKDKAKLDLDEFPNRELLIKEFKKRKFDFNKKAGYGTLIDEYYKEKVRPFIVDPIFLIDHPIDISPLAKRSEKDPRTVERVQLVVVGAEVTNGYSELNDPIDQRERFIEQAKALKAGDEEAQRIDDDYIEAMEYGMPPIAGQGIGMERLIMLLTNSATIRECTPFPFMKPEKKISITSNPNMFSISDEVKNIFPDFKTGVAIINDVRIEKENIKVEKFKEKKIQEILTKIKEKDINEIPEIAEYRRIYKQTGIDPTSKIPSPLSLLKRLKQGKGVYKTNTIVDLYNLVVMEHGISIGAYNFDNIKFPVNLLLAKGAEKHLPIMAEKEEFVGKGELIYIDKKGTVICRSLNYRDSEITKVDERTKSIILFIDGTKATSEKKIQEVLDEVTALIVKYAGGKIRSKEILN